MTKSDWIDFTIEYEYPKELNVLVDNGHLKEGDLNLGG